MDRRDFELYLLSKLRGDRARQEEIAREPDGRVRTEIARAVGRVFDHPVHSVDDYERVLGPAIDRLPLATTGAHAGATAFEFHLPLVPDAAFVVNATAAGAPLGVGFEDGGTGEIEPWRWTADRVREIADSFEVTDQWEYDLGARVTLGGAEFEAVFGYGLLLDWLPAAAAVV